MEPVSAVLITFNESTNLASALDALNWCDEILVVDSGSTDDTREIALSRGAKVITRPFQGFGPQKQFAVSQARNHWVLCLDADEVLSPELSADIQRLNPNPDIKGYWLKRSLVFMNRHFRYGRESREYHLRLFDKRCGNFDDAQVHEKAVVKGKTLRLKGALLHYSYPDTAIYFRKFNEYTDRASQSLLIKGKTRAPWKILISLPFNFVWRLLVHGNIFNGFPGWIWALYSAFYPVVKYTKVWEKRNQKLRT